MEKTFPFSESPGEKGTYESILPTGQDEECSECGEEAEALILEAWQIAGVWRYRASYLCKPHLDEALEIANRYRECRRDADNPKRQDNCMDAKEKAEGFWKHQGKEDLDS